MKAASFDYQRPSSLKEATDQMGDASLTTKVLGGGQSLGPMLNLRLTRPQRVVDVSSLGDMRTVTQQGDFIRIGAAVTHAEIEDGVHPLLRGSMLQSVAGDIAYRAIRNRGTIGGSLAHADPAADWVLTAAAVAAQIEITSATGQRRVPMAQFMLGAYTTAIAEADVLSAVWIPALSPAARWGYYKFCRKTGEFAEASCAAAFDPTRGLARIVLGALDGAPQALPALARDVARTGALPGRAQVEAAVTAAAPTRDIVHNKLRVAAVERCLKQALLAETSS